MNRSPLPVLLIRPATETGVALLAGSGFRQRMTMAVAGWALVAPVFLYLARTPLLVLFARIAYALLGVYAWRIRTSGMISNIIPVSPAVLLLVWVVVFAMIEPQHHEFIKKYDY